MKRITSLIAIIGISLLIAACSKGLLEQGKQVNYRTGTTGLEVTLLSNMPPRELPEGSPFRIGVKLQNRGAYDTRRSTVTVAGLSEAWTPLAFDQLQLPPLKGRSLDAPDGDIYVAEFTGRNIAFPPSVAEYRSPFWVITEYEYETIAQADVCISADILELESSPGSCKAKGRISLGSQGAPVVVTNVEQVITPIDNNAMMVQMAFTVENRGSGELASPLQLADVRLANRRMDCDTGDAHTRRELTAEDLEEGSNKVTCTIIEPLQSPYTTTFSVVVDYTYRTITKGAFTIRRRPQR